MRHVSNMNLQSFVFSYPNSVCFFGIHHIEQTTVGIVRMSRKKTHLRSFSVPVAPSKFSWMHFAWSLDQVLSWKMNSRHYTPPFLKQGWVVCLGFHRSYWRGASFHQVVNQCSLPVTHVPPKSFQKKGRVLDLWTPSLAWRARQRHVVQLARSLALPR